MGNRIIKLNESQLRDIIRESVMNTIKESGMFGDNNHNVGGVLGDAVATRQNRYENPEFINKIGHKLSGAKGKYKSADELDKQIKRIKGNVNSGEYNHKFTDKDAEDYKKNREKC